MDKQAQGTWPSCTIIGGAVTSSPSLPASCACVRALCDGSTARAVLQDGCSDSQVSFVCARFELCPASLSGDTASLHSWSCAAFFRKASTSSFSCLLALAPLKGGCVYYLLPNGCLMNYTTRNPAPWPHGGGSIEKCRCAKSNAGLSTTPPCFLAARIRSSGLFALGVCNGIP